MAQWWKWQTRWKNIFLCYSIYIKNKAMAQKIKNRISDDYFIKVCSESETMSKAAATLKLHFNSF